MLGFFLRLGRDQAEGFFYLIGRIFKNTTARQTDEKHEADD